MVNFKNKSWNFEKKDRWNGLKKIWNQFKFVSNKYIYIKRIKYKGE